MHLCESRTSVNRVYVSSLHPIYRLRFSYVPLNMAEEDAGQLGFVARDSQERNASDLFPVITEEYSTTALADGCRADFDFDHEAVPCGLPAYNLALHYQPWQRS